MDTIYTTELVALGASLAELAVKGTATAVSTKSKLSEMKRILIKFVILMTKL